MQTFKNIYIKTCNHNNMQTCNHYYLIYRLAVCTVCNRRRPDVLHDTIYYDKRTPTRRNSRYRPKGLRTDTLSHISLLAISTTYDATQ